MTTLVDVGGGGGGGGGGPEGVVTATLSNVDVLSVFTSWLGTRSPINADVGIVVVVLPTVVQVDPFEGSEPVTGSPDRTSLSHAGVGCVAPASHEVEPFVAERAMNSIVPSGRTSRMTCAAPAAVDPRSI